MVSASKRRVSFKFGFTNIAALSNGLTGQECRGSEHEVVVTWSLSSGKQAVTMDGHEIFFDVGDTTQTKFQHAWPDKFGHTLQVKIHVAPISTKANPDPDWRQHDLLLDGISFFNLPKIYEIGVFAKDWTDKPHESPKFAQQKPARAISHQANHFTFNNEREVEHSAPAGVNTSPFKQTNQPVPEPVVVADLLSFDDSPVIAHTPAPVQTDYSSTQLNQNHAPPSNPFAAPTAAFVITQEPQQTPPSNPFVSPTAAYVNQQTLYTHNVITPTVSPGNSETYPNYRVNHDSSAMYSNNPMDISPSATPGNDQFNPNMYASNETATYAPAPVQTTAPVVRYPAPVTQTLVSSSLALVPAETTPSNANGAMQNLVNLDDLFGISAAPVIKASVDKTVHDMNAHRSLGELKGSNNNSELKRSVMNPFDSAPAQQMQGMYPGYAPQHNHQEYNNYSNKQNYQQSFSGFQYQQATY